MRVVIDARFYGVAGPGRYVRNLLNSLEKIDKENEYFVLLRSDNFHSYNPKSPNFKKVLADYPWYSFKEQVLLPFLLYKLKPDVLHVPHFNFPIFHKGRLILTIHDLIMHRFSTIEATNLNPVYYKIKRLIYRFVVLIGLKMSYSIIVPSETVKQELIDEYSELNINDKIVVAYEGVDPVFNSGSNGSANTLSYFNISKPYILYVGSSYPHKNVKDLITVFKDLIKEKIFTGQLVLVGKRDNFAARLREFSLGLSIGDKVIFPAFMENKNYVSDTELIDFYKHSMFYVFPSLAEGFSLTPLEAMSLGVPCLVSDIPVHKEVFKDSVLYFESGNLSSLKEKMTEIINSSEIRDALSRKGRLKSLDYSFDLMAEKILSVYKKSISNI